MLAFFYVSAPIENTEQNFFSPPGISSAYRSVADLIAAGDGQPSHFHFSWIVLAPMPCFLAIARIRSISSRVNPFLGRAPENFFRSG